MREAVSGRCSETVPTKNRTPSLLSPRGESPIDVSQALRRRYNPVPRRIAPGTKTPMLQSIDPGQTLGSPRDIRVGFFGRRLDVASTNRPLDGAFLR